MMLGECQKQECHGRNVGDHPRYFVERLFPASNMSYRIAICLAGLPTHHLLHTFHKKKKTDKFRIKKTFYTLRQFE